MAQIEVKVPDIGDFKDVAVIEVMVKPGETVAVDTSLIMVESDKASMEIPSSHAGVVKEVKVRTGAQHQHVAFDIRLAGIGRRGRCGRRRAGDRRRLRCWRGFRRDRRTLRLQHKDHRAFTYLVARLDLHFLDDAGVRGRNLHRRLVRLDHD